MNYTKILDVLKKYPEGTEEALIVYLDILYNLTGDDGIPTIQKEMFDSHQKEKSDKLKAELLALQNSHFWGRITDIEFVERKTQIENELVALQNKSYLEEKGKMLDSGLRNNSLENMIDRYVMLVARRDAYGEFDTQIPENLLKEIRSLKRSIKVLVESEKDKRREELELALRETETKEEKRERLQKELEELVEES